MDKKVETFYGKENLKIIFGEILKEEFKETSIQ